MRTTRRTGAIIVVACAVLASQGNVAAQRATTGLDTWGFLVGEWELVEKRYGFDAALIETNAGRASFSRVMNGERIQELQTIAHGDETITALHLFVYNPRSEQVEIARTDSGHFAFWVIVGTMSEDRLDLKEKHPDAESEVTRRISYRRVGSDEFVRQLEFSTDGGANWVVRSEWTYRRR